MADKPHVPRVIRLGKVLARHGMSPSQNGPGLLRDRATLKDEGRRSLAAPSLAVRELLDAPDLEVGAGVVVLGVVGVLRAAIELDVGGHEEMRGGHVAAVLLAGEGPVGLVDDLPALQAKGFGHGAGLVLALPD